MGEIEGVLASPAPDVMVVDLAGSSINLRARWWTAVPRSDVIQVKSQVLTALRVALTKAQIDLPFPTRVVLFHDQTDGDDGDRTRQREGWPAGDTPPAPRKRAAERAIAAKAKS
jgi:small conductance mechanosensitive channel